MGSGAGSEAPLHLSLPSLAYLAPMPGKAGALRGGGGSGRRGTSLGETGPLACCLQSGLACLGLGLGAAFLSEKGEVAGAGLGAGWWVGMPWHLAL